MTPVSANMACNFPKVSILSKNFFQLAKTLRVDLLSYSRIFHSFARFSRTRERDMDKTQLTALLQFIKNAPDNDSLTATILRLAADSISLDTLNRSPVQKRLPYLRRKRNRIPTRLPAIYSFPKRSYPICPNPFRSLSFTITASSNIVTTTVCSRPVTANRDTTSKSLPKISIP